MTKPKKARKPKKKKLTWEQTRDLVRNMNRSIDDLTALAWHFDLTPVITFVDLGKPK